MATEDDKIAISTVVVIATDWLLKYLARNRRRIRHRVPNIPRAPYTYNKDPSRYSGLARFYTDNDTDCNEQLRMRRFAFHSLCARLKTLGLADSRYVCVEEQLAMFLLIIGHDNRCHRTRFEFRRSSQTVSHYFHLVLNVCLELYRQVVVNATAANSPLSDGPGDVWWHQYFKDAVGAIDGTHFPAMIVSKDQARYRNRKGVVSQNVLVACTFDMRFTYVLAGWEGSAHDGRLLRSVVTRQGRRLTLPFGKYYLADVGFALSPSFLTPYRGVRYHLKEHGHRPVETDDELYNYRHSQLRNVVERIIGVLKMRFAYLRKAPYHNVQVQSKIILACCAIHNFLKDVDPQDELEPIVEDPDEPIPPEDEEPNNGGGILIAASRGWTKWRDNLKKEMWTNFVDYNEREV